MSMTIKEIKVMGAVGCLITAVMMLGFALSTDVWWITAFDLAVAAWWAWRAWCFARLTIIEFPFKRLFVNGEEIAR
jgi:hypothetical protein